MRKKLISALPPLRPSLIVDIQTGEVLSPKDHDVVVGELVRYVRDETVRIYNESGSVLEEAIKKAKRIGSANSFGRQHGIISGYKSLPRDVRAKSRINELILHKVVSETASYVNNPNPQKNRPSFGPKINLGAVDSQMASLSLRVNVLTLRFKAWALDLLLEFEIPQYILERDITKWSLPSVEITKNGIVYIFSIRENPRDRTISRNVAGVDLGRKKPAVIVVTNHSGSRIADYVTSPRIVRLNDKRERILVEKKHILRKASHYEQMGINSSTLRTEGARKSHKALILGEEVALQVGSDVASKLKKHEMNVLAVEDLRWATGTKYGSRWNHGRAQESIEHAVLRDGITVKKVNPKNTSQTCHRCGNAIVHNTKKRTVFCSECRTDLDRDFNAAMNIAHKLCRPDQYGRIGDNCSPKRQVVAHENGHGISLKEQTSSSVT